MQVFGHNSKYQTNKYFSLLIVLHEKIRDYQSDYKTPRGGQEFHELNFMRMMNIHPIPGYLTHNYMTVPEKKEKITKVIRIHPQRNRGWWKTFNSFWNMSVWNENLKTDQLTKQPPSLDPYCSHGRYWVRIPSPFPPGRNQLHQLTRLQCNDIIFKWMHLMQAQQIFEITKLASDLKN